MRRRELSWIGWCLVSLLFATGASWSQDDEPEPPPKPEGLTPEQRKRLNEELADTKRFIEEMRARQERQRRRMLEIAKAMRPILEAKLPAPPLADPSKEPTVDSAVKRGLAWLAAHQRADGHWDVGLGPGALATSVVIVDTFEEAPRLARLRISIRLLSPSPRDPSLSGLASLPLSPREVAVVMYCQSIIVMRTFKDEETVRQLAHLSKRLLNMRNPDAAWGARSRDGRFDAIATGWAILALRATHEAEVIEPGEWRAMGWGAETARAMKDYPLDDAAQVAAALLRRGAECDDPDDPVVRRLSRRLAEDLRANPSRKRTLDEWYLGARALKEVGASEWYAWRDAMTQAVLRAQRRDASWPDGASDDHAGRVRATALAVLCLRTGREP